jgi:hypothetical protein
LNKYADPNEQAVPDEQDPDLIIRPGSATKPFVIPWCASCKDTVDHFTIDAITSPFRMGIQATCHGATEGIWVSVDDLFARKREGKPVVMFKRAAFNRVRA